MVFTFNELWCHTGGSAVRALQDGQPFTARMSGMLNAKPWGPVRKENEMLRGGVSSSRLEQKGHK